MLSFSKTKKKKICIDLWDYKNNIVKRIFVDGISQPSLLICQDIKVDMLLTRGHTRHLPSRQGSVTVDTD
jgi:hypothetical protein